MQKEYDVITPFDVCVDFLVDLGETVPEFGQKEKLVDGYNLEMGGSACIFACGCAKLGLKVTGAGYAGDDEMGALVVSTLKEACVDTSHIRIGRAKTALTLCLTKPFGDRSILTYMGEMDSVRGEWITQMLSKTRHIHICSYYLLKGLQESYPNILSRAKEFGCTVSLDSNYDPDETWDGGINNVLPYVDIFLPNENELRLITGKGSVDEALRHAGERIPLIAVKCGENGAYAYEKGKVIKSEAIARPVADTVGAGDNFNAGFIFAFLQGYSVEDCLRAGVFCGSESVTRPGGTKGQTDVYKLKKHLGG